jgi:hypothetical protein
VDRLRNLRVHQTDTLGLPRAAIIRLAHGPFAALNGK